MSPHIDMRSGTQRTFGRYYPPQPRIHKAYVANGVMHAV